jgi:hypothetical protein
MALALQVLPGIEAPRPVTSLSATRRCDGAGQATEVTVCGRRRDEYRLPLPRSGEADLPPGPPRNGTGMAAITPPGRCGIFAGERRCGKREAAAYGYGKGRDPVTVLIRLAEVAAGADPD